jgi:hypothetical protein
LGWLNLVRKFEKESSLNWESKLDSDGLTEPVVQAYRWNVMRTKDFIFGKTILAETICTAKFSAGEEGELFTSQKLACLF